jgi:molybdate transport system substrate-binding protein
MRALLVCTTLLLSLPAGAGDEPLRVLAAASLTDAFDELSRAFEQAHPGAKVELGFAGTQVLHTQVEQGADADVFVSADVYHAAALEKQGLLEAPRPLAHNRLVVVTPAGGSPVEAMSDLAKPFIRIVLASPSVPAGRYALQALSRIAEDGRWGRDFATRVRVNVVSEETNVRAVLAKVSLGEADAGIVYATDARAARGQIRTVEMPPELNVEAEYRVGILRRSPRRALAEAFVAWSLGPAGQAILRSYGFGP